MEEDVEVIFEGWLHKLTGLENKKKPFRFSSTWKERYFVLKREGEKACLLYYDRKPRTGAEQVKDTIWLHPSYQVSKRGETHGKHFVCQVMTTSKKIVLAAESEKILHLFVFFLQAQTKLKEDLEAECFVVRPDNSEDQRKIGARGNMCLLHVSSGGLTVALQLSKAVLAQWPLKSVKFYESTNRGQFLFEAGRKAPMGAGSYAFNTRMGQDNRIYDMMDRYVMEAAGLRESSGVIMEDNDSDTSSEYSSLLAITFVCSDPRFSGQLKRISRDIYDHLEQHIGGETSRLLAASSPDLLSDSAHMGEGNSSRSGSVGATPAALEKNQRPSQLALNQRMPGHSYMNERQMSSPSDSSLNGHRMLHGHTSVQQVSPSSIDSQYLHMGSPLSGSPSAYLNNLPKGTPPPTFFEATKGDVSTMGFSTAPRMRPKAASSPREIPQESFGFMARAVSPGDRPKAPTPEEPPLDLGFRKPVVQTEVKARLDGQNDQHVNSKWKTLERQRSRSVEDLNEYMRMSMALQDKNIVPEANSIYVYKDENVHTYSNQTCSLEDENSPGLQAGKTTAVPFTNLRPHEDKRHSDGSHHGSNRSSGDSSLRDQSLSVTPPYSLQKHDDGLENYGATATATSQSVQQLKQMLYAQTQGMKKSMSNPNLIDPQVPVGRVKGPETGAVKPASNFGAGRMGKPEIARKPTSLSPKNSNEIASQDMNHNVTQTELSRTPRLLSQKRSNEMLPDNTSPNDQQVTFNRKPSIESAKGKVQSPMAKGIKFTEKTKLFKKQKSRDRDVTPTEEDQDDDFGFKNHKSRKESADRGNDQTSKSPVHVPADFNVSETLC